MGVLVKGLAKFYVGRSIRIFIKILIMPLRFKASIKMGFRWNIFGPSTKFDLCFSFSRRKINLRVFKCCRFCFVSNTKKKKNYPKKSKEADIKIISFRKILVSFIYIKRWFLIIIYFIGTKTVLHKMMRLNRCRFIIYSPVWKMGVLMNGVGRVLCWEVYSYFHWDINHAIMI